MFRSLASRVLFVILFLIPFALFIFYELAIVSDRYQSETSIIIGQERSGSTTFNIAFLGLPASADDRDADSVVEFMQSRDLLQYLDDKFRVRDHYSSKRVDWWNRLRSAASFEELHAYMPNWYAVSYDTTSKIIRVQLQTFNENYSRTLLEAILAKSQEFVDRLNAKMTADQLKFFDEKMAESDARLKEAKQALLTFQRVNKLMTTESESTLVLRNITTLQTLLTQARADIESASQTLSENAPRLQQLKQGAAALEKQIKREKERLSGTSTSAISELDAQERDIQLNLESVLTMYRSNLSQLEQARIEAARRVKFLVTVAAPSLADEAQLPIRAYNIAGAGVILLAVYFIVAIAVTMIREHA
jgi:capsular polysaccharide transport system permease protein